MVTLVPHPSLNPSEYYRHIDAQVSDPIRMKQLLLWCGQKLLSSQPNVSRVQLELLENISKSAVNISWYHRPSVNIVEEKKKVGHPVNVSNTKQLHEFENVISRLESELEMWNSLKEKYANRHQSKIDEVLNLKQIVLAYEPEQEPRKILEQELVDKSLEDIRREVHHLESVMHAISVLENKTSKSCESLFSMMLKAYAEREKDKNIDPIDMLKLLSTSH